MLNKVELQLKCKNRHSSARSLTKINTASFREKIDKKLAFYIKIVA